MPTPACPGGFWAGYSAPEPRPDGAGWLCRPAPGGPFVILSMPLLSGWKDSDGMAIRVRARSGESVEQLQRRFKKLCEKEGLTKDVKRKQYFEKPSERRRRAQRKSANRIVAARGGFRMAS